MTQTTLAERFHEKVDKTGNCHIWTACRVRGYGQIGFNGKRKYAHHVAWFLAHGAWPAYLMHSCDNPACVNPAHLSEGGNALNTADSVNKGRHARGESHGNAMLNEDKVRGIRRLLLTDMTQAEIADIFGVSNSNISLISTGKAWKHIGDTQ